MRKAEHWKLLDAGDISPRVVQHDTRDGALYVAWTPTWEGPARPEWCGAWADLCEHGRKNKLAIMRRKAR
jgi:hypothetical protein